MDQGPEVTFKVVYGSIEIKPAGFSEKPEGLAMLFRVTRKDGAGNVLESTVEEGPALLVCT